MVVAFMVAAMVLTGATIVIQNTTRKNDTLNSKIIELQDTSKRLEQQRIQEKEKLNTQNQQYQQDIDKLKQDLQAKADAKARQAAIEASRTAELNKVVSKVVPVANAAPAGSNAAKMFIYMHESGNNPGSINKSSGACGLGQALPCAKMGCSLSDYACQDAFFTRYMQSRYGTWENAMAFWLAHKWW